MTAEIIALDTPRCPVHRVSLGHTEDDRREPYGWHCPALGCPTFVGDDGG